MLQVGGSVVSFQESGVGVGSKNTGLTCTLLCSILDHLQMNQVVFFISPVCAFHSDYVQYCSAICLIVCLQVRLFYMTSHVNQYDLYGMKFNKSPPKIDKST